MQDNGLVKFAEGLINIKNRDPSLPKHWGCNSPDPIFDLNHIWCSTNCDTCSNGIPYGCKLKFDWMPSRYCHCYNWTPEEYVMPGQMEFAF